MHVDAALCNISGIAGYAYALPRANMRWNAKPTATTTATAERH